MLRSSSLIDSDPTIQIQMGWPVKTIKYNTIHNIYIYIYKLIATYLIHSRRRRQHRRRRIIHRAGINNENRERRAVLLDIILVGELWEQLPSAVRRVIREEILTTCLVQKMVGDHARPGVCYTRIPLKEKIIICKCKLKEK